VRFAHPFPVRPRRSIGWIVRRVVFVVLLLLAVLWVGFGRGWLGGVRQQLAVRRALDGAATYTPPTTQHVVYDDDPRTYPLLLARGARGGYASEFRTTGGIQYAAYNNPDFNQWVRAATQFQRLSPICFLHERTSSNGTRRVVAVQISFMKDDRANKLFLSPTVLDGPATTGPPRISQPLVVHRESGAAMRVYDGQIDVSDRSRFVFVVEHNGQRIDVNGQLLDDGTVTLTPANGPGANLFSQY